MAWPSRRRTIVDGATSSGTDDLNPAVLPPIESLISSYRRLVHRIAVRILQDEGEAEDVTQEIFLEVHQKRDLYDPTRGTVKVWLMQYAYHRSLRRKDALKRRAAYRAEPLDRVATTAQEAIPVLTPTECRWMVRAGLARLPDRQRTALELVCFEDLPLRDVAQRLHVSLGCARHYYYRGLASLRAWAQA